MSTTAIDRKPKFIALLLLGLLAVNIAWLALEVLRRHQPGDFASAAILLAVTWFLVKQGTVRVSTGHLGPAFVGLGTLGLARVGHRHSARLIVVSAAMLCGLLMPELGGSWRGSPLWSQVAHPIAALGGFPAAARLTLDERHRIDVLRMAKRQVRDDYSATSGLTSGPLIEALRAESVHVEPWDIAAGWAYDLNLDPLPVPQTYSAYTTYLDHENADRASSQSGPSAILAHVGTAIDGKNPVWEAPHQQVAVICNFAVVEEVGDWKALHRTSPHCGKAVRLKSVVAKPGEAVEVPVTDGRSLIVARVTLPDPLVDLVISLAWRPYRLPTARTNIGDYRLPPESAPGPLLVRAPLTFDGVTLYQGGVSYEWIAIGDVSGPIKIEFDALPLELTTSP
jgi:hypothetical protein